MDKTTLGLIAAVGAFAASPALASAPADVTDQILNPRTIAELLEPIPQPVETLAKLDAAREIQGRQLEGVEVADAELNIGGYGIELGHHHHHYQRHYVYHHHHHHHYYQQQHHHHHQYYHHHHHHQYYNNNNY